MLFSNLLSAPCAVFLLNQTSFVFVLITVIIFFGVLLILGALKSFRLKKENERLDALNNSFEEDKTYKDFTEGHLYGGGK